MRCGAWLGALALLPLTTVCAGPAPLRPEEVSPASYAFAHELGSGVYESGGHALQIYRIPLAFEMGAWRLTLPVTVGLLDFRSSDVLQLNMPSGLGSVSLVPGIEKDYRPAGNWTVTPFAKAGYTRSSSQAPDAVQFGAGVRSRINYGFGDVFTELNVATAVLRGDTADDHFVRLRNGVERVLNPLPNSPWRFAPWAQIDMYLHAPRSPVTGSPAQNVQSTVGISAFEQTERRLLGIKMPALGVAYRIAGDQSGWYLAFGRPF